MPPTRKPIKEKTFCSAQQAAEMLGVTVVEVEAMVEAGALESWPGADGRKLILSHSVRAKCSQDPAPTDIPRTDTGRLLVYVIDDSHDVLQHYREQFSKVSRDILVMQFDSVFDALLRIGKRKPHLLILDLRLLAVDWYTLIWSLWHNPEMHSLKIVVGTEMSENIIASRGALPPEVQVFCKPIPLDVLESIVVASSR